MARSGKADTPDISPFARTIDLTMLNNAHRHPSVLALGILILATLVSTDCVTSRSGLPVSALPGTPVDTIHVGVRGSEHGVEVRALAVDEYVLGSLLAEADLSDLDSASVQRLAQVQAILARTYALANLSRHADQGFDLCATTHCQVYRPVDHLPVHLVRVARDAVHATAGRVVAFGGQPINAVFHADCGGHTSDADAVWEGDAPPYLRGAPDVFCLREGPTTWRFEVDASALRDLFNQDTRTRVGAHLDELVITRVDDAGRVQRLVLEGEHRPEIRGVRLRALLTDRFGPRSIMGTRFSTHRAGARVVFEGQGVGHGVGLCQAGAKARARVGDSPETILQHYYPGTRLQERPVAPRAPPVPGHRLSDPVHRRRAGR